MLMMMMSSPNSVLMETALRVSLIHSFMMMITGHKRVDTKDSERDHGNLPTSS